MLANTKCKCQEFENIFTKFLYQISYKKIVIFKPKIISTLYFLFTHKISIK